MSVTTGFVGSRRNRHPYHDEGIVFHARLLDRAVGRANMTRPLPPKDPQAVADLVQRAKEARERLPGIVQQIEDLVRTVDPIELLSQLTLLFQTHPADKQPNRHESVEWQVRIEWLAWLVFLVT